MSLTPTHYSSVSEVNKTIDEIAALLDSTQTLYRSRERSLRETIRADKGISRDQLIERLDDSSKTVESEFSPAWDELTLRLAEVIQDFHFSPFSQAQPDYAALRGRLLTIMGDERLHPRLEALGMPSDEKTLDRHQYDLAHGEGSYELMLSSLK